MNKIFLYYYDRKNLGDDLFVHMIAKRYPNVKFYIWSKKENKRTFAVLKNLIIINQDSKFLSFLKRLRPSLEARYKSNMELKCDAVVYIGGSIFIEYDNWKEISNWWNYEAENRKFFVLGANFGPYQTEDYRKRMEDIFRKMEDICFRDQWSKKCFSGVPTVRYAPDILLNYPMPQIPSKRQVFVSLIDCSSRTEGLGALAKYEQDYLYYISELLKKSIEDGYHIVLCSFCEEEGDQIAIKKMISMLNKSKNKKYIKCLSYTGVNVNVITKAIAESEWVLATRFHASILGFAADKPVFPIIYSDKTKNVLNDMGFSGLVEDIRKLEYIKYEKFIKQLNQQKLINQKEFKRKSQEHFRKLDKLLM
jgi:colanic acid/amylovoran biosynthesis protein